MKNTFTREEVSEAVYKLIHALDRTSRDGTSDTIYNKAALFTLKLLCRELQLEEEAQYLNELIKLERI